LQQYNTLIVGGDVVRSPVISLSITAFGQALPNRIVRRSAAVEGNAIVITGVHGASRAGLELLLNPELGKHLSEAERSYLIQAHQRPKPRLDVLPLLWNSLDSYSPIQVAGMDSSDGLADAILQLCRASGVGAKLERTSIPLSPAMSKLVSPQTLDWVLYGGEDFELVLCLPPEPAKVLVEQIGGATIIGNITTGTEVWLTDSTGTCADELLTLSRGFQHF
jgi:thiamine-monophosphate kinase